MYVRARFVVFGVLAALVLLVLAALTAMGWQIVLGPSARAVTGRKFDATDTRLARGKYLVEGPAACFHCHSDHNLADPEYPLIEAKKGAGWVMPIPELGMIASRNITPDPETGIGTWTDDEIARAIQEGVSKDGTALFPIMPYMNFRHLDDEDLASIIVYLRSIPPVKNQVLRSKLIFPLNLLVNTMPQPLTSHEPAVARTTAVARGEYLVKVVAGCHDCHTPADQGRPLPGMEFGGGGLFHDPGQHMTPVFSLNITQDPSGIAHYDEALFIQTLHTGQIPGRMLNHIMPFETYRNLTDDDLRDIFAYLRTRPPVMHRVSNTDPPTKCPICNQEHGLGDLNKKGQ
jgi:mono/diheme cytochrome c family protein